MLSFEHARQTILDHVTALGSERISLLEAGGRMLAEDVLATWAMPQWDNSAMDGFAVRQADCTMGATLKIEGYIPAGGIMETTVMPGTAAKIMTGAPTPPGADAIIPFEETSEQDGTITIATR